MVGSRAANYDVNAALRALRFLHDKGIDLHEKSHGVGKSLLEGLLAKDAAERTKFKPLIDYLQTVK